MHAVTDDSEQMLLSIEAQLCTRKECTFVLNLWAQQECVFILLLVTDEMIQCDACDAWFHFEWVRIQIAPDDDWFCSNCID